MIMFYHETQRGLWCGLHAVSTQVTVYAEALFLPFTPRLTTLSRGKNIPLLTASTSQNTWMDTCQTLSKWPLLSETENWPTGQETSTSRCKFFIKLNLYHKKKFKWIILQKAWSNCLKRLDFTPKLYSTLNVRSSSQNHRPCSKFFLIVLPHRFFPTTTKISFFLKKKFNQTESKKRNQSTFIVNSKNHYVTYRLVDGQWWLHNSLKQEPLPVSHKKLLVKL